MEDIGRDDYWHIDLQGQKDVPFLTIQDGDYIATTCVFNSDHLDTATVGGLSSQEEMCIGFLSGTFSATAALYPNLPRLYCKPFYIDRYCCFVAKEFHILNASS